VKSCATDVFFKSLSVSSVVLGLAIGAAVKFPLVVLVAVPLSYLLGAVARIILHKYATANRILGYELHLARVRRTGKTAGSPDGWWPEMAHSLSWEEALKAWRVVQATCFQRLYGPDLPRGGVLDWLFDQLTPMATNRFGPHEAFAQLGGKWKLDVGNRNALEQKEGYPWWDASILAEAGGGVYHGGGYLEHVLKFLQRTQAAALVLVAVGIWVCFWQIRDPGNTDTGVASTSCGVLLIVVLWWRFCRFRHLSMEVDRRRHILEHGLLSIESCAIMWQAVVLAHCRAVQGNTPNEGYIVRLAKQADVLAAHLGRVHAWIRGERMDGKGVAEWRRRTKLAEWKDKIAHAARSWPPFGPVG